MRLPFRSKRSDTLTALKDAVRSLRAIVEADIAHRHETSDASEERDTEILAAIKALSAKGSGVA